MESGSKAPNLDFHVHDLHDVELIDNRSMVEKYQLSETAGNFPRGIMAPSGSSPPLMNQAMPMLKLTAIDELLNSTSAFIVPNTEEAPHKQKTTEYLELDSPSGGDDQMKANADSSERLALVIHGNPDPLNERVELLSSTDTGDDSFHQLANSNKNLMLPAISGGTDSLHVAADARNAQQTATPPYSPLIMQPTNSFPLALAEKLPQNGSDSGQSLYSEHEVNSFQANQLNDQIGSSHQAEYLRSQRGDRGKTLFVDQFEHNIPNINFNNKPQALSYPNLLSQSSGGTGFLNEGSKQFKPQLPSWLSSNMMDYLYRPSPLLGSQVNQIRATNSSDLLSHNLMLPRTSQPLRPQQLSNPLQLTQIPNMPSASDSLLQHSDLGKHSVPMQPMSPHFSYQHNQFPMALGAYNSQTCSNMLLSSTMPLRTPMLPSIKEMNPLDASNLQYGNSLQSNAFPLSSGRSSFPNFSDNRQNKYNPIQPTTNQFGTQNRSNSMLQEPLIHSSSYQLPAPPRASNQFSLMPSLPTLEHQNSQLPGNSILLRQPSVQPQGLLNQTARPIATYPSSRTSLPVPILNSLLLQPENTSTTAPLQMETSLSNRNEDILGRRGNKRSRIDMGESSSFKRFRREPNMPQASTAEQVSRTSLSLQTEATTPISASLIPRPIQNSVYNPLFEGIGLPVDPHLRMFGKR